MSNGEFAVAVIAPHADDEAIGCGGTLRRLHLAGARIGVMLLTRPEPFETRRHEHAAALQTLGVTRAEELNYREQSLPEDPAAIVAIYRFVCEFGAQLVLVPHAQEMDPDHRVAHRLTHAALKMQLQCNGGELPTVWEYEVWSPLTCPSVVVNVTAVAEEKRTAILHYASQVATRDYVSGTLGLNAFRACTLGIGRGYAEAFGLPLLDGKQQKERCIPLA